MSGRTGEEVALQQSMPAPRPPHGGPGRDVCRRFAQAVCAGGGVQSLRGPGGHSYASVKTP